MRQVLILTLILIALCVPVRPAPGAADFHGDYYLGFSQGAYYGLMLAGEGYHVAWCMKAELEYEAGKFGTGSEFQAMLERLLAECRSQHEPSAE